MLNVYATRNSVVYNDTFMIKTHHSSNALISKISGSKYGSVISIRAVCDSNGNCYIELKDTANSIANTATQNVNCTLLSISCGTLTKYTTFTDGSTLPTDFKEAASLTTNTNSLQGNLSWGEITGKPSTFAPSSHTHNYAGSASAGGSANSAVKLDTATAGSATQPVYFSGGKPVATTYTLGKSVPSDAKFTDTVYSHPNSGVTAGTYRSVTVNAQGHVTGGSNPTTLAGYGITDAAAKSHTHTASQITDKIPASKIDGVLSLSNIPAAAQERVYVAADDTARLALTTSSVQNGDVVKVTSTGKMYFVVDETKLNSEAGYMVFAAGTAASVAWANVTGKPSTFTPSSHTHNYAGSGSAGGSANSAVKLDSSAGSATQPVYFSGGKPVTTTYTLGKSVPSDAVFTDHTYSAFKGATSSAAGGTGLVPAPGTGNVGQFLRGDGTWATPTDTKYTHPNSGVTAGTYKSVTVNAQGHVTGGSNPTTLAGYGITDAAAKSHTHNYAGSSSAGGSANSAVKLATARTVSGGTDITMSYSYDGSANSSASIGFYTSCATAANSNNYPFHRFAKIDTQTGSFVDKASTFLITQDFTGGGYGIVRIVLRTNNSSNVSSVEVKWLVRAGLSADSVQIGLYNVYGKTYADAFFKMPGTYGGTVFRAIANGARGGVSRTWTLINSSEPNDTTTSDAKTSVECYATIAAAATKLHNQAYTNTVVGVDAATTSYSNGAGTAVQLQDSNDKKAITAAYSKAGMNYGDYTWMAAWNGYELRAINKNQFAQASHSHSAATSSANGFMSSTDKAKLDFGDIVYVSKTAPTKACIWVKLD